MQLNQYNGPTPSHLHKEIKSGWQQKTLTSDMLFIHGGPVAPDKVRRQGLDAVQFGREWVVDLNDQPFGGGKLLFSFMVTAGNQPPANITKPAQINRFWGTEGHCYVFLAPAGTTFYSNGAGQPTHGAEIAFPYLVESSDIKFYCSPTVEMTVFDRNTRKQARRLVFNVVRWNVVEAVQKA